MEHRVPHDVGRELAKKATVAAFATYAEKYGQYSPRTVWDGEYVARVSFSVKGLTLEGRVEVRDREIGLDMDVPFLLKPFRAKALDIIEREIGLWCDKAKAGQI